MKTVNGEHLKSMHLEVISHLYISSMFHKSCCFEITKINKHLMNFSCTNGSHILTMHQERIVRMPGCSSDLCDMKTLKRLFRKEIENCDFEQICYVPKIKSTTTVTMNPSSDSE